MTLPTIVCFLAQAGGAPSLDATPTATAAPAGAATGTATAPTPGAPAAEAAGSQTTMIMMMLAIVGVMIVFSVMGSRRERKKRAQMLSSIKKHDRVLTVGGIVGSVAEFKDDTIILKVDEHTNTRITVSKTAISQVLAGATAE